MPRVKRGNSARNKHKKVLKANKGYRGASHRLANTAGEKAFLNAGVSAYRDRRKRRRFFRSIWIIRINAAVRNLGMRYSEFIDCLQKSEVNLDRKQLAQLAVENPKAFEEVFNVITKKS